MLTCRFPRKYCCLASAIPTVISGFTRFPNYSMTGNQVSNGIGSNSGANCTPSIWRTDAFRNIAVGDHLCRAGRQKCIPNFDLKICALENKMYLFELSFLRKNFLNNVLGMVVIGTECGIWPLQLK